MAAGLRSSRRAVAGADVWWGEARATALRPENLAWLDGGERARAAGLAFAADRGRFLAAHVMLRQVLSRCTGLPAGGLAFRREDCPGCGAPHGRPALRGSGPQFSLSYSGDLVVVAVADRPVGVDVQQVPVACVCALADDLGPAGAAALRTLPEPARHTAIVRWWVRAEAAFKCRGGGVAHRADAPRGQEVRMLSCQPGYLAAIATAPRG